MIHPRHFGQNRNTGLASQLNLVVQTASNYFVRRADQERKHAANSVSDEVRKTHAELAFRLLDLANDAAQVSTDQEAHSTGARAAAPASSLEVDAVLRHAFMLPELGAFEDLLQALDLVEKDGPTTAAPSKATFPVVSARTSDRSKMGILT